MFQRESRNLLRPPVMGSYLQIGNSPPVMCSIEEPFHVDELLHDQYAAICGVVTQEPQLCLEAEPLFLLLFAG
jgi:hypothetical protein